MKNKFLTLSLNLTLNLTLFLLIIFSSLIFSTCKKEELKPGIGKDTTGSTILIAFINGDEYEDSVVIKPIAKFEKFNNVTILNLWDQPK